MTEQINMKQGKTNNNVPESNTLKSFNTSSPNTYNPTLGFDKCYAYII